MQLLLKHKLLIAGAVIVVAASAGGAYAATQSNSTPQQAYLKDVAKQLHVSPAQLKAAMKGALIDRLNALVKAGKLTQAQASRIEKQMGKGEGLPFFFGQPGPFRGFLRGGFAVPLKAATSYLGITDTQLLNGLRSGQSLAQIARSHGKAVSGLESALISAEKSRLDKLASSGAITNAQEQKALSRLSKRIDKLVNRSGLGRGLKAMMAGPGPMMGGPGPWKMKGAPRFAPGGPPQPGPASGAGPTFGPPPPTA